MPASCQNFRHRYCVRGMRTDRPAPRFDHGSRPSESPFSVAIERPIEPRHYYAEYPVKKQCRWTWGESNSRLRNANAPLYHLTTGPSEHEKNIALPSCRPFFLVGLPRIELGLHDPQPCVLPLYDSPSAAESFGRGAGNRTRSTRTRSVRTTGILRPDQRIPPAPQKRGAPCRIRTCDLSNVNRTL